MGTQKLLPEPQQIFISAIFAKSFHEPFQTHGTITLPRVKFYEAFALSGIFYSMRSGPPSGAVILFYPPLYHPGSVYLAPAFDAGSLLRDYSAFPDLICGSRRDMIKDLMHGAFTSDQPYFSGRFIYLLPHTDRRKIQRSFPDTLCSFYSNRKRSIVQQLLVCAI